MSPDEWSAWAAWAGIVATLGIAIVGWSYARRANTGAKVANEHAAEALELAKSSEKRADRLERIALERRDVTWEHRKSGDRGILALQNVGSDTANDVVLIVDPQNGTPRQTSSRSTVEPAGLIDIDLTALATEARQRMKNAPPGFFLSPSFTVRARITWSSESGVPGIQEWAELRL